jgi:hypothetical protein
MKSKDFLDDPETAPEACLFIMMLACVALPFMRTAVLTVPGLTALSWHWSRFLDLACIIPAALTLA